MAPVGCSRAPTSAGEATAAGRLAARRVDGGTRWRAEATGRRCTRRRWTARATTEAGRRKFGMASGRSSAAPGSRFRPQRPDCAESETEPLDDASMFSRNEFRAEPGSYRARNPDPIATQAARDRSRPEPRLGPAIHVVRPMTRRSRGCTRTAALTCRDCTEEFIFSAGEQTFYATQGSDRTTRNAAPAVEPPPSAPARPTGRASSTPRSAGACGGQAIVPFAPRNDRPVYCSSCFDKVRAGPPGRALEAHRLIRATPQNSSEAGLEEAGLAHRGC